MKAKVVIRLKEGVLDPQGKAIHKALNRLSFEGIREVRQAKVIEIDLKDDNRLKVESKVVKMCRELLVNTVIENYEIEIVE